MGGSESEMQHGTPIDNHIVALIISNQTQKVIDKLESDEDKSIISESVNFKGDTFLHYACAKNNQELVDYLLKKCTRLANVKNNKGQFPHDLATDERVRDTCKRKAGVQSLLL